MGRGGDNNFVDASSRRLECLSSGSQEECSGPVEQRSLDGVNFFPRCEKHFEARLEKEAEIRSKYPMTEPSDFDPGYAGERWFED